MDTEKILETARKSKSRGMEYENKETTRSSMLGSFIALLVGISLFLVEYFVMNSVNVGMIAVGMTAASVQSLYEGIKLKKLYLIVFGIIQVIITIFAILIFIRQAVLA